MKRINKYFDTNTYTKILTFALVITVLLWAAYEKNRSSRPAPRQVAPQVELKTISGRLEKENKDTARLSIPAITAEQETRLEKDIIDTPTTPLNTIITHDSLTPESFALLKVPLQESDNKLSIPFSLSLIESQRGFSSTLLRQATGFSTAHSLVLSLESADPESTTFSPIQFSIPLNKEYRESIKGSFDVPVSEDIMQLAIYACIKSAREPACSPRKTIDLSPGKKKNPSISKSMMYFQYVLIDGSTAYLLDQTLGDKRFYGLKQFLKESTSIEATEGKLIGEHKRVLKRTVLLNMLLRSPGIKNTGNTFGISLFGNTNK